MVSQEAHEHSSTTCNGNVLFAENKIYECKLKIRGLSMEDVCVEKSSTPPVWIFFWNNLFEVVFTLNFTFAVFFYHGATVTLRFHDSVLISSCISCFQKRIYLKYLT